MRMTVISTLKLRTVGGGGQEAGRKEFMGGGKNWGGGWGAEFLRS